MTLLSVPIIALTVRENEAIQAGDTATGLGKAKPAKDIGKKDVEGVFVVGWAKRGPSGTIPTNRGESHAVAQEVLAWLKDRDLKSGPDPIPLAVDFAGWHRIDKAEIAAGAKLGRPRVKLTDWKQLLEVAQGD